MGRRYLAHFNCVDCGQPVERMWESGRAKVCLSCGEIRFQVATDAARAAVAEHTRLCRLRLELARQAAAEGLERGVAVIPLKAGTGRTTRTGRREEAQG